MKVIKRNGELEDFEEGKVARVVHAAGLSEEQAQQLGQNVSQRIKALNAQQVTTIQIRDVVIEEMNKIDKYATDMFIWYQKGKDERQKKT
ncbi:MAG: hypothetical protein US96_C0010G0010 [Candidatus Woesebacteria bacterium GW2011_GWB1_38_5b]|uniref:ATP-cone domain-containing protein n=1 Tax=Candidatus Woesebacteria bacterium GW2011_GWB1_38_5b TaxID=1618569 RepID=A0A0G0MP92_9BACT|nr:MAG: hypothetical protein US96_C0010G0010 [Candidatus Woesebacteria bacterium GW2011_GWB1_38_5b]